MLKKILFIFLFCIVANSHTKEFLTDYGFNKHSQYGEDGIIQKIFEIIGTTSKVCVEFGAWDGVYLSNTANLWLYDNSWKAYLIEADQQRFQSLLVNTENHNCCAILGWVGIEKDNCLECILANNGFDLDTPIDLLSIDIDSNDYYVFKSLERIRPRVIVCEYNPTMPYYLDIREEYSSNAYCGCSARALEVLAHEKGYKLVAVTQSNCFFVRDEDFYLFENFETDLKLIHVTGCYMFLVTTYDGRYVLVTESLKSSPYGIYRPYEGALIGNFKALPTRF